MRTYLVLIRELDGRDVVPPADELRQHQQDWKVWLEIMHQRGYLLGGKPLTLTGTVVRPTTNGLQTTAGPYRVDGQEIVGGYLLMQAADLPEATALLLTCPVFDTNGFIEIRETM